jgi:hypothetical protein
MISQSLTLQIAIILLVITDSLKVCSFIIHPETILIFTQIGQTVTSIRAQMAVPLLTIIHIVEDGFIVNSMLKLVNFLISI